MSHLLYMLRHAVLKYLTTLDAQDVKVNFNDFSMKVATFLSTTFIN